MKKKFRSRILSGMLSAGMLLGTIPGVFVDTENVMAMNMPYLDNIYIDDTSKAGIGTAIPNFYQNNFEYDIWVEDDFEDIVVNYDAPENAIVSYTKDEEEQTITVHSEDKNNPARSVDYVIRCRRYDAPQSDDFEPYTPQEGDPYTPGVSGLKPFWSVYKPDADKLHKGDGYLEIVAQPGTWYEKYDREEQYDAKNVVYQSADGDWESVTHVTFNNNSFSGVNQSVGVMIINGVDGGVDTDNYIWFRYAYTGKGEKKTAVRVSKESNGVDGRIIANNTTFSVQNPINGQLYFKVEKLSDQYVFSISTDGNEYVVLGSTTAVYTHPLFGLIASSEDSTPIEVLYQSVNFEDKNEPGTFQLESGSSLFLAEEAYYMHEMGVEESENEAEGHGNISSVTADSYALYNVKVNQSGYYEIKPQFASSKALTDTSVSKFDLELDGELLAEWSPVGGTGDGQKWMKLEGRKVYLKAGEYKVKLSLRTAGIKLARLEFEQISAEAAAEYEMQLLKAATAGVKSVHDDLEGSTKYENWEKFLTAYATAVQLETKNPAPTSAELKAAREALEAEAPVTKLDAAKERLGAALAKAKGYSEEVYKDYEGWAAFSTARVNAEEAKTKTDITAIDTAAAKLVEANSLLDSNIRSKAQNQLEEEVKAAATFVQQAEEKTYTDVTWNPFDKARTEANAIKDGIDTAPLAAITAATEKLSNARNALETVAEVATAKDELTKEVAASTATFEAAKVDYRTHYYSVTWDVHKAVYEEAKTALEDNDDTLTAAGAKELSAELKAAREALVPINKKLNDICAEAEQYKRDENLYSAESRGVFNNAYDAAVKKNEAIKPTQELTTADRLEIETLIINLDKAMKGLLTVGEQTLFDIDKELEWTRLAEEELYVQSTWNTYSLAVLEAKSVKEGTDEQVAKAKLLALQEAKSKLVTKIADAKAKLTQTRASIAAKGYAEENYTEVSWAAYIEAASNAREDVPAENSLDDAYIIYDLEAKLVAAEAQLKTRLTALKEKIAMAEANYGMDKEAGYTAETWKNYQTALTNAKAANEATPIATVNGLTTALESAIGALRTPEQVLALDRAELVQYAADVETKYPKDVYEETRWANLKSAIDAAKAQAPTADAAALSNLRAAIDTAVNSLVSKVKFESDALQAAITEAQAIYAQGKQEYTEESWNVFKDAYDKAAAVSAAATAEEIAGLRTNLVNAKNALTTDIAYVVAKNTLQQAVNGLQPLYDAGNTGYTEATWLLFEMAFNNAKNPSPTATTADLNSLNTMLLITRDALEPITSDTPKTEEEILRETLAEFVKQLQPEYQAGQRNYTEASWKAFTDAYEAAVKITGTEDKIQLSQLIVNLMMSKNNLIVKSDIGQNNGNNTNTGEQGNETGAAGGTTQVTLTPEEEILSGLYFADDAEAKDIKKVMDENHISMNVASVTDEKLGKTKNDKDMKGSSFAKLPAKAAKQTKSSVKLSWSKVKGASGYRVYGAKSGNAYELLKDTKSTSYTQKKLKKATSYKYIVIAYKSVGDNKVTMAVSKTIHTVTTEGKVGVTKSLKVTPAKLSLRVGKTKQLKVKETKTAKKTENYRKISYESSDVSVATVSKNGKIKAKKKGSCSIFVYAQNGVYKKIAVTVK